MKKAEQVVCFTGHRKLTKAELTYLQVALRKSVEEAYGNGARIFRAGGALGFDTLAALSVLDLRKKHPEVRLELILPCPEQCRMWDAHDVRRYESILEKADEVRYIGNIYYEGILHQRNLALIQEADICICYLRESHGGTAFTVTRALQKGLEIVNLADGLPKD